MTRSYLRFPHLQGDALVFVAEDDIWTAPVGGGRAYRVTNDDVPASSPRISPDGTKVAWASRRDGGPEVYVSALDGGGSTRLTYWGAPGGTVLGWAGPDEVIAASAAGDPTHRSWAYAIPLSGGPHRRLPVGPVSDLALRPGLPTVIRRTALQREMAWWKRYRGGSGGQLWSDRGSPGEFHRILAELDGNLASPMLVGEGPTARIAFLSDHEGWGNLYSVDLDCGDLRRHTDHGAPGEPQFYARHAATDGTRVVYESAGQLYLLESLDPDARPQLIDVQLAGPRSDRAPRRVSAAEWLESAAPDRTGRTSITVVRGTVHRLTHRDGPARVLLAEPGVRARYAQPLGEDRAVWIDDAEGEDAVCVAPLDPLAEGAAPLRRTGAGQLGRVLSLVAAPDGNGVAVTTHDGRLLLVDAAEGVVRELASAEGEITDVSWSPDSAWLAYVEPAPANLCRIVLTCPADGRTVAVTEPRFRDADPVFTSDGKYLAFLSRRSFDPIYDQHSLDLAFPASWRPYLVPLAARTPSPFGASPDGRPVSAAEEGPQDPPAAPDEPTPVEGEETKPAPDKKRKGDEPPEVVVDIEGLASRVVPVPVEEGRYAGLRAGKDCLLWYRSPVTGVLGHGRAPDQPHDRPVLERYDLVRRKLDVIVDGLDWYEVSGDGQRIVVADGNALRLLRTDRSGSGKPNGDADAGADEFEIDTRRIAVTVDPSAEWRQMFDEAARLMRDHFWVEDMAGVDWAAEVARYRPLVDAVGSHDDLVDLLWEVQGELGTSHAYVRSRGYGRADGRPGFLGADLTRTDEGWRVERVLPPDTSVPTAYSPLAAPGVDVREGDLLLEVNGRPIDPDAGPAPLLVALAGKLVELTVRTGPGHAQPGEVRRVVVRPLASEAALRYQDWVAGRRAAVAERSGGRLGYLHVPDMMADGWAQLHRDLTRETAHEGLILDVRGNAGGHTSQLVVEKLARRVIGWEVIRNHQSLTYPLDAPRGPVVALADEMSGSDGDIVTAAIKRLGIGPVVGTRTWGGIIGIDSRYTLVDGTGVTQPRYGFWFDDTEWSIENRGVEPDIEVEITPQDWVAGRDPQLERAVDIALERLAETPAVRPPDPATRPSRRRPELPPRSG
ncbi:tricorn protease [Pseudonocardia thermophila]|uniref:Tricorn protease homolog n=1 Tax=Pseudonocardia thermophila TaxID=1848 RepID=A0A1M6RML0_PSETH|nr:S41 family peptidase [Pseudonocardia thermophila]SHK33692.1 tricorn protease [Pseudonocardia thermophila]